MATSPNFSWPEPDNTDLVKNGALAIRTAVNAIDTSLVDLKGGTTGQVLSKTSATDMDFTWVTTDDANAIQNAIVDAKGDLIAATANDTPARLAVGTNKAFLQADSAQSTGLKWNYDAWTSYTPTITASSGSFTTVSGTGLYSQIGKAILYRVAITITTNGTAAGNVLFTLPVTAAANDYVGTGRENAVIGVQLMSTVNNTSGTIRKYDNTYPGGTGYQLVVTGIYEVA